MFLFRIKLVFTAMKNYVLVSFLAFVLVACNQSGSKTFIAANNPNIAYIGRFDFTNKMKPVFMYSGCAIRAVFSGTSVDMVMKDDSLRNMFTVIIDDSLFVLTTNRKDGIYLLATNLKDKNHIIEINRRTEWHAGNTVFEGFNIDKGKKLYRQEIKERKIEFIGDSYTCGYGNEGKSREEHFRYETENNWMTFGAITARALNSEYYAVCRSGIGMAQGYGGGKDFTMPKLYDEVTINNKKTWDFTKFQPQLVVIDLAGNDLSAPLDSATFVNTYVDFLRRIGKSHSASKIICAAGPSSSGDDWQKWKNYIHAVVNQYEKINPVVHYFEFTPFEPNGSDWHPNVAEHKKMAEELIPYIKTLMNW
jgi:hypothetical protein